jgi:hypothetical protein
MRWAATARAVVKVDARRAIETGDTYAGNDAVQLRYYAEAACLAAGITRCEKCKQFQSLDGSHTCPSERYDDTGFNATGYNRMGFDRQGFSRSGLDAEGFNAYGYKELSPGGVQINRHGYTAYHTMPNGRHASGYFNGRDGNGVDFYGYSSTGVDAEGYDRNGYSPVTGRDRLGFDSSGYSVSGDFIGGAPDANGLYSDGYDSDGYDSDGYDAQGLDRWRFNRQGVSNFQRAGIKVTLYKDGRSLDGMRYAFFGCDVDGFSPTGFNADGFDRDGNPRKMRSQKTGRLVYATYDEDGIDPYGYDRWGFSQVDGLSTPDADGRRIAPNGWVYDPASGELVDPDDSSRRMAHSWNRQMVRVGRKQVWKILSTGTPPPLTTPLIDGNATPANVFPMTVLVKRDPPAPLNTPARLNLMRSARDPKACIGGVALRCPHCGRFTGGDAHLCPGVKKISGGPGRQPLGTRVYVLANGIALDRAADPTWFRNGETAWAGQRVPLLVVHNPQVPDYDPTYRFGGYESAEKDGRDADGFDRFGYNDRGYSRKGYNREGFDVLGYDAEGYDRSGYNRQGKDRQGKARPLTVAELQRSLAPGDEPLASDDMARHYSRLAQAITGKPVTVKFDTSIPTGATDMRGNIYLNPHPLGKDADPARNMIVVKSIMYHEVGHELTTNGDHWAELKGIAASPVPVDGIDKGRALILRMYNIVEDGRMERDMSDRFPGVAGAIAAAARLRDKWDFAVGEGVPPLHQVMGALLYTTLPYYRVPQEVIDKMTPEARALYEDLRPIALRGALGSQDDSLEASKEIVRRLERAGLLDEPPAETPNIEATPPGGAAGNKPPKAPKPPAPRGPANKQPKQPENGEGDEGGEGAEGNSGGSGNQGDGADSGQRGSGDEPNGRGKGWRKGQKTASDDEDGQRDRSGVEDDEGGQGGNPSSERDDDATGDGEGAGGSGEDEEGGQGSSGSAQGEEGGQGSSGSAQGEEGEEGSSGGAGGGSVATQGDDGEKGEEGSPGGARGSSGGQQGDESADGGESSSGGTGSHQGGQQSRRQGGEQGEADGDEGDEGGSWDEGSDGDDDDSNSDGGDGWNDEANGDEASGDSYANADGDNASSNASQAGNRPNQQQPQHDPDQMLEPEMGEGSDNLGGDGSGSEVNTGPVAISGEMFDPIEPFTDSELDAALKAADREAAQVIVAQVRRQANYSVLGAKLHRPVSDEPHTTQSYRTSDGRVEHTQVVQPRSANAAHIRSLEGQAPLHREVSGRLARQLQTIRAQADQRVRLQTSGKLDQRRIVAAMRGSDEVRVQVREMPATSMAVSLTLDFSGSMHHHIQAGKVYNAASILGATFEQLDMPYEIRGHADASGLFKSMGDERRDPSRMAMTAVQNNGCGGGNAETAPTMGLSTSSLMAREEKNKLIVSLMDGDMYDHEATVAQLSETRKQGVVTFGVFLGRPSASQQTKLSEMFGAGSWVQINDLSEMPQAIGRRLARTFEAIGKK